MFINCELNLRFFVNPLFIFSGARPKKKVRIVTPAEEVAAASE